MNIPICVLCPYGIDSGLLSKAVEIANDQPVRILIPEYDLPNAISCGASMIHTMSALSADETSIALWLKEKIKEWQSTIILAPATVQMRNIMPMLAWHLKAGLTADCTQLSMEDGILLQTRPAFGNSLMATIESRSRIQMATVRPGTFPCKFIPEKDHQMVCEVCDLPHSSITLSDFLPYSFNIPLTQAQIIVAGGIGIGSKEGFQKLGDFAHAVGGTLAASRNAVDAGYMPYHYQVGMTGATVSPKLYIAVGISGAVQHLSGMSGSEKVIAINSDPSAPIFDYADYGIVADWESVIDKLLEELS